MSPHRGRPRHVQDSTGEGVPDPAWQRRHRRGQRGHHAHHRAAEDRQQLLQLRRLFLNQRRRPDASRTVRAKIDRRRRRGRKSSLGGTGQ